MVVAGWWGEGSQGLEPVAAAGCGQFPGSPADRPGQTRHGEWVDMMNRSVWSRILALLPTPGSSLGGDGSHHSPRHLADLPWVLPSCLFQTFRLCSVQVQGSPCPEAAPPTGRGAVATAQLPSFRAPSSCWCGVWAPVLSGNAHETIGVFSEGWFGGKCNSVECFQLKYCDIMVVS